MFNRAFVSFIKIAISIVLVISLWLVITAAFKKDIGNLSDWISSLSTFGTLVVAYMAFKAAPKWINQKQEEDVYALVKELILDDFYQLNRHWTSVSVIALNFEENLELLSDDLSYFLTKEECEANLAKGRENSITPAFIKHKIKKIEKLNGNLDPAVLEASKKMLKEYANLYRSNALLWIGANKRLAYDLGKITHADSLSTLLLLSRKIKNSMSIMDANYKLIENFSSNLTDYFDKKS